LARELVALIVEVFSERHACASELARDSARA
jgi:hypothetical protein